MLKAYGKIASTKALAYVANFKENNAFWVARVWPFMEHIALFQPVLPHPSSELSVVCFVGFLIL